MNKALLCLLSLISFIGISQNTYVPDDNFEAFLEDQGYGDGIVNNDYILTENIFSVLNLNLNDLDISDFTGIEDFALLRHLNCNYNNLSGGDLTLDLSNQLELIDLSCWGSSLNNIILPNTPSLVEVSLKENELTSIDLSNAPSLETLNLKSNSLTEINLSNNSALQIIHISDNILSSIDFSDNPVLIKVYASENELVSLDLSNNPALEIISVSDNQLTEIDVFTHTELTHLVCENNNLSEINLENNSNLTHLICTSNQISCLSVKNGNNEGLSKIYAQDNPLLTCIDTDSGDITGIALLLDEQSYFDTDCVCEETLRVNDQEKQTYTAKAYPNPNNGKFKMDLGKSHAQSITIYSSMGKEVASILEVKNNQELSLNLPTGVYYMNIHFNSGTIKTERLIIK